MTTPPENAPGSAAGSPNHLGWHGQWLQAAAECLGVAPRSVSLARNRGAGAQGSLDGDDSAASALFGDEPTGEPATADPPLALSMEPGQVVAEDRSSGRRTVLTVRRWGPARWARARASLSGDAELERSLMSGRAHIRLRQALIEMQADPMPSQHDLSAECSCGRESCKHLAALLVALADEIASDPLLLLMLRGVDRVELGGGAQLDETPAGWPRARDPGIAAATAWSRHRQAPALASHRPPSERVRVDAPPADSGLSRAGLGALADLAAHRAAALLDDAPPEADGGLGVLAERLVERGLAPTTVAKRSGLSNEELEVRRRARVLAGEAGVAVLLDRFEADPDDLADGATALGGRVRQRANLITSGPTGRQLRIDRRGRWWLLRSDPELGWVLVEGPSDDPASLCEDI